MSWKQAFRHNDIFFLLVVIFFHSTLSVIHVEDSGLLPVNADSYALQFYLAVANDAGRKLTVSSGKPRCCWEVEKGDLDCKSMVLIGGNEVIISPKKVHNISFLFPTTYPMDRVGKCHFLLKVNKQKIQHIVMFNTTEPRKEVDWKQALTGFGGGFSTCKGVDLDPRNECKPVDCLEKYNGFRSFFDKERGKCIPVHDCYTKMEDNKDVPEIAFDKDHNECKSLVGDKLTDKQRKFLLDRSDHSSLAKKRVNLEDVKEINPVPLNCNHGQRVGSTCVCDNGWGTDTSVVASGHERYIFNWCNKRILTPFSVSLQIQTIMLMTGLGLISFSLFIGLIIIVWGCFITPGNSLANEHPGEETGSEDYSEDSSSTDFSSFSDSSQPRFGIVTKSYEPRKDDELRLKKGQRIRKLQYTNRDGMMKGELKRKVGYFPLRNIKIADQDDYDNYHSSDS